MKYWPDALVTPVNVSPVLGFRTCTEAFGTAPPPCFVTVPVTAAPVTPCALAPSAARSRPVARPFRMFAYKCRCMDPSIHGERRNVAEGSDHRQSTTTWRRVRRPLQQFPRSFYWG